MSCEQVVAGTPVRRRPHPTPRVTQDGDSVCTDSPLLPGDRGRAADDGRGAGGGGRGRLGGRQPVLGRGPAAGHARGRLARVRPHQRKRTPLATSALQTLDPQTLNPAHLDTPSPPRAPKTSGHSWPRHGVTQRPPLLWFFSRRARWPSWAVQCCTVCGIWPKVRCPLAAARRPPLPAAARLPLPVRHRPATACPSLPATARRRTSDRFPHVRPLPIAVSTVFPSLSLLPYRRCLPQNALKSGGCRGGGAAGPPLSAVFGAATGRKERLHSRLNNSACCPCRQPTWCF